MKVEVLAFAWAKDAIGGDRLQVEVPEGTTVEGMLRHLAQSCPRLAQRTDALTIAVNEEFVDPQWVLKAGDEVALIPPISGGSRVSDL
ncbi:MAG: molybdopterin converting factor subunit 1 [Nitrospinota bacterium]